MNRAVLLMIVLATFLCAMKKSVLHEGITKEFLTGKFDPIQAKEFTKVVGIDTADSRDIYLQREVAEQYVKMYNAAKKDGIKLKVLSGTRNFEYQTRVWNRKINGKLSPKQAVQSNMRFVAMPMTSRHHWGTDVDFYNISNDLRKGKREYFWLQKHAYKYGFYQVYTSKEKDMQRTGYREEKWHWSYLPLACKYLKVYNEKVKIEDIKGFVGDEFSKEMNVINVYINGVTEKAKSCDGIKVLN